MKQSIVLTGARCTGKTTKGKIVADKLDLELVDGDEEILKVISKSGYQTIKQLVDDQGWEAFRKIETESISDITGAYQHKPIVFTPGGGAVAHDQGEEYRQKNVELLMNFGTVFYLVPFYSFVRSAAELTRRLLEDPRSAAQRPSLTEQQDQYQEMLSTLQKRDSLYREAAHHVILTEDFSNEEAAELILEKLNL